MASITHRKYPYSVVASVYQNKFKSREFGLCIRETDSCNKQKVAHNVIHMHAASPRQNWRWCICNLIQHPFMNQLIHCQVAVVVGPVLSVRSQPHPIGLAIYFYRVHV